MRDVNGQPADHGRIPFTFRIGVTGHRRLDDPVSLVPAVREALRGLAELLPGFLKSEPVSVVVSALAEGADRLVAEVVLAEEGSRLEAALPLRREDYIDDFEQEVSKQEFLGLLARASEIWQAPAGVNREEAYERAGQYVVDRSDAVVALWDGERTGGRGGTAAIVSYARKLGVPLAWVSTKGEPVVVYEVGGQRAGFIQDAASKLDQYNAAVIEASSFHLQARVQRERLIPETAAGREAGHIAVSCARAADWLIPYFVRADILSLRLQRRFWGLSSAIFVMAAVAVAAVAIQANFFPRLNWLAALEVILLLGLLSIPLVNRRWRLHEQWISYRFLSERLRSAYFLTLAGTGDRRNRPARLAYVSDSSEAWIERALSEVMARRPGLDMSPSDATSLRDYLNRYWISSQITYHKKAGFLQGRSDQRLTRATAVLFAVTLVAAVIHMLGVGVRGSDESNWEALLIVLSIAVPAIGAAVHGVGTQREYRRHSDRYRRMAELLVRLQEDMGQAESLERIREIAADTERIMREESSDWFGVMRFHDMELIT
jgi:hypothetical protein